ncbi:MAG: hypothetical protein ACT6FF_04595, partial [Methanosarcinaceae archaeon]
QINDERQYSFRQLGHKQNHKAGIADEIINFVHKCENMRISSVTAGYAAYGLTLHQNDLHKYKCFI